MGTTWTVTYATNGGVVIPVKTDDPFGTMDSIFTIMGGTILSVDVTA